MDDLDPCDLKEGRRAVQWTGGDAKEVSDLDAKVLPQQQAGGKISHSSLTGSLSVWQRRLACYAKERAPATVSSAQRCPGETRKIRWASPGKDAVFVCLVSGERVKTGSAMM